MAAPDIFPLLSNWISTNLPNRLELLFRTVFAFPKASRTGLDSRTCCSTVLAPVPDLPPRNARYLINNFVVSVLPAPLSPLTKMELLFPSFIICL
uniref:Myo1 n=1 Tax=Arundo donax TaxID=35708 RepID=A0A0A9E261_ARUDO